MPVTPITATELHSLIENFEEAQPNNKTEIANIFKINIFFIKFKKGTAQFEQSQAYSYQLYDNYYYIFTRKRTGIANAKSVFSPYFVSSEPIPAIPNAAPTVIEAPFPAKNSAFG